MLKKCLPYLLPLLLFAGSNCTKDPYVLIDGKPGNIPNGYQTQYVVVLVMDGPRYSETWGDPGHRYIPEMSKRLAREGAVFTSFYQLGSTFTISGHAALTTGHYENLNNNGSVQPSRPSIFHLYEKKEGKKNKSVIIAGKGKLNVLAGCAKCPQVVSSIQCNCGIGGNGTGYRSDKETFDEAMRVLGNEKPELVLVQFMEPDLAGHAGDWAAYLRGIESSDHYIAALWDFIQNDPFYAGKTSVFVTNDHGRHLDGHKDGFVSHGDKCRGCRHINLFASGPDFRKNVMVDRPYHLLDITRTIAELLGIDGFSTEGRVIWEIFREGE